MVIVSHKEQRRLDRKQKRKRQKVEHSAEAEQAEKSSLLRPQLQKTDNNKRTKSNSSKKKGKASKNDGNNDCDPYANLPPDVAAAMRRDDEEIAALEAKMGMNSSKDRAKLHKEYAKLECYGDDFGSFLDDVDNMVMRVVQQGVEEDDKDNDGAYRSILGGDDSSEEGGPQQNSGYLNSDEEEQDDDDDEIVPMKEVPLEETLDEEDLVRSSESEEEEEEPSIGRANKPVARDDNEESNNIDDKLGDQAADSDDDDDTMEDGNDDESEQKEPDHKAEDTYQPSSGEDIYGNPLDHGKSGPAPKKYVPPHLRKQQQSETTIIGKKDEQANEEDEAKRKMIQRSLNNALNRLSEDTLISVAKVLAPLYQSYPTPTVNECLWKNLKSACIERPHLMTGLIPVYVACIAGVHFQKGDSAQLGEYILEMATIDLWKEIQLAPGNKKSVMESQNDENVVSKEASNLMLLLCYLYNYGIVHCSFMYAVVRRFIDTFREIEVELLLLILSHCGRALRSDDPLALKEIVMLVQKRALDGSKKDKKDTEDAPLGTRVEYMISAIMDLKNNKKRKNDTAYADKVTKLRKILGQVKASSSAFKSAELGSLRIGLDDILNVTEKGRWWKVGASWVGNQYSFSEDDAEKGDSQSKRSAKDSEENALAAKEDAKLLKLAAKARMNTDSKRAIFCIIMKSADCEDAFEKLSRAGYLKNRKERDVVRVLMECCGNEKYYNPFYAHLAARVCDFQPQCKFSMQLAYWDFFKQFDDESVSIRKAANLAKLLLYLVVQHHAIRLSVLKVLDLSSPDELEEPAMIFLTIFFTNLLEHFEDPSDCKLWLEGEVKNHRGGGDIDDDRNDVIGGGDDEEIIKDDTDGVGPSISIFLLQTLKASPKYKKGSKFRKNLKAAVKACDMEDFFL